MSKGFDRKVVEKTAQLLARSEYKRFQAAPGPKVTNKALEGIEDFLLQVGLKFKLMDRDLHLSNSLGNKKRKFEPLDLKNIGMYVCGPTVYDDPHIGNAATYSYF